MDWQGYPDPREPGSNLQRLGRMLQADWRRMETDEFLAEFASSMLCTLILFGLLAIFLEWGILLHRSF